MSNGLLEGVEEVCQPLQLEFGSSLIMKDDQKYEKSMKCSTVLNPTMKENWNDHWTLNTEDSLLQDALEELQSSANSPVEGLMDMSLVAPSFSLFSHDNNPDFINCSIIEGLFTRVDDLEKENLCYPPSSPAVDLQTVPEETNGHLINVDDICNDDTTLNTQHMFPNLITSTHETETVDVSKDFFIRNGDSTTPITPNCFDVNNSLELLMKESGIIIKHENELDSSTKSFGAKRKAEKDASVPSKKSSKLANSDTDESSSIFGKEEFYSPCNSSPEDRLTERRKKNNIASKVARANRKARHEELFKREQHLKVENSGLRTKVEEMTKEAEVLRRILIEKLTEKSDGCKFVFN